MYEATLRIFFDDVKTAKAIFLAVEPDNLRVPPKLSIRSRVTGRCLEIYVSCRNRIETLIQTLDDLLSCIQVAERSIKSLQ